MSKIENLENKSGIMIGSGIFAGLVASLCCVGPLVLTILGVSGAAFLSKLEVLRIPMIFVVILLFSVAGHALYRKRKTCEPDSICADPKKFKKMIFAYWIGLAFAIAGVTSPYWIVWIFG